MQIDVGTHALVEVGPHAAAARRLHQTQRAAMMFGKPGHHHLFAADEILIASSGVALFKPLCGVPL